MGKKKNNNNNNTQNTNNNDAGGDGKNNSDGSPGNVVLKVDMHCDGCASKIIRSLRSFPGVETVKAESETGKITVTGKVDPAKLKEKLSEKTKKKVELISPQPKKENKENNEKKNDEKKPKEKETPVTTAVLKVALHCQGCIDKIGKTVKKTKGVHDMVIDKEKETLTLKGTMDVKALTENLKEKLKRKVEVVPPKKDNKEHGGSGGGGNQEGSGKKKNKGGGGGGNGNDHDEEGGGGGGEQNMMFMDNMVLNPPPSFAYGYAVPHGSYNNGGYGYVPVYPDELHLHHHGPAPQIFSDENPNACSVM